jgi:hypothetical protein
VRTEQVLEGVGYRPAGRVRGETMRSLGRCAFPVDEHGDGDLLVELAGREPRALADAVGIDLVEPRVPGPPGFLRKTRLES